MHYEIFIDKIDNACFKVLMQKRMGKKCCKHEGMTLLMTEQ
jgi:hypothetical protein